jgi:Na+/H+ antiporter NhaC
MRGVVNKLEPYAHNPRSGQYVIWLMGILIFFDDYANTLVVGNTMRPVADRLNISREKLAYLVDSTAAPVAAIAFITTWIGAELGYIQSGIVDIPQITESPYSIFLNSLAYSFYPLFTLAFMLILIHNRRDFGPMVKAELAARENKEIINPDEVDKENLLSDFEMKKGIIPKAYNAVIPILVIIFGVIWGMYYTGSNATDWTPENLGLTAFRKLSLIIGNADSFTALLWASVSGAVVAIIMTISQKIMNLENTISAGISGYKTMLPAMLILVLAWSLAVITEEMHTAVFLNSLWSDALSPFLIPAIVFILSALVSFSTGSSWGTMAILYPLLLPASYHISIEAGLSHDDVMIIFYNVVSVILAGSVFGDHCSPISDTTILSSLASSCNHIDHVRTQLPYALTTGFIAVVVGTIPASMGVSPLILFPIGIVVLYATVRILGKKTI